MNPDEMNQEPDEVQVSFNWSVVSQTGGVIGPFKTDQQALAWKQEWLTGLDDEAQIMPFLDPGVVMKALLTVQENLS